MASTSEEPQKTDIHQHATIECLSNVLAQPFQPLLGCPARADLIVHHTIEDGRWTDMDAHKTTHFDRDLQVVRDPVARVQAAVLAGLVRYLQQRVHLIGAQARAVRRELGQSLISGIACFVDDAYIKVGLLVIEQRLAKGPELGRVQLHYSEGGFVHESGRGVPRLDLLAEDDLHLAGELRVTPDLGSDRSHECVEYLCRRNCKG